MRVWGGWAGDQDGDGKRGKKMSLWHGGWRRLSNPEELECRLDRRLRGYGEGWNRQSLRHPRRRELTNQDQIEGRLDTRMAGFGEA